MLDWFASALIGISFLTKTVGSCKNISTCLFSVHNTISLSRDEQVCLYDIINVFMTCKLIVLLVQRAPRERRDHILYTTTICMYSQTLIG